MVSDANAADWRARIDFAGWDARRNRPTGIDVTPQLLSNFAVRLGISASEEEEDPFRGISIGKGQRKGFRMIPSRAERLPAGRPLLLHRELDTDDPFRSGHKVTGDTRDRGDLRVGKWALVVLESDFAAARRSFHALLERRRAQGVACDGRDDQPGILRMTKPASRDPERWIKRLRDAVGGRLPFYLLLVGGPDRFPFEVQYLLDSEHATGRIDGGSDSEFWDACRSYSEKVVRFERHDLVVEPNALFYSFATDDHTRAARHALVGSLLELCQDPHFARATGITALPPDALLDERATTEALVERLQSKRPAGVFTTSHGLEFPAGPESWGALTDHSFVGSRGGTPLSALTVPSGCFAPGAVVFSFACFSAGIPERSAHRYLVEGKEDTLLPGGRIAALPQRLLSHPEGPVAFIGHVDRATSGAFASGPIAFVDFLEWSLGGFGTLGQAMRSLRASTAQAAIELSIQLSPVPNGRVRSPERLLRAWIRYHDAQGYLLLGDPAVRMRDGFS